MNDFGGFDWNGNGARDSVDKYMDYKVSGSGKTGASHISSANQNKTETPELKEIVMVFLAAIICFTGWFLAVDFLTDYPFIGALVCFGAIAASLAVYNRRNK